MEFHVSHTSEYQYGRAVILGHHQARLEPRSTASQTCVRHELSMEPVPKFRAQYLDWFGNRVEDFSVEDPHRRMAVHSVSRVIVRPPSIPPAGETLPWETAVEILRIPRMASDVPQAFEFTLPTPLVPVHDVLRAYGRVSFPPGRPLLEGTVDLMKRVHADFKYDPTATNIHTTGLDALRLRRGVCQDYAHVMISALRSLGLAARYVSGYVQTTRSADKPRLVGADASHAWVSIFVPAVGWVDLDPTNDRLPSEQHITVAWGRDYRDVSPVKGIVLGGGSQTTTVSVHVVPKPDGGSLRIPWRRDAASQAAIIPEFEEEPQQLP